MKTLSLFFLTVLAAQNCANKMQDKFPIAITEAYHQHWVSGVRGGGSGTGFYIIFEKEIPETIQLTQLYFRKRVAKPNKISEKQYLFSFGGPITYRGENEPVSDVPSNSKDVQPPFKISENDAILEYVQKGTKKYFKLTNVKEKEMLAYPSARPSETEKN